MEKGTTGEPDTQPVTGRHTINDTPPPKKSKPMKGRIIIIILAFASLSVTAAITDPGRVAAIEVASKQAEKAIKAQEKAQLLMTT